jgi:hypothetical protein
MPSARYRSTPVAANDVRVAGADKHFDERGRGTFPSPLQPAEQ